MTRTIPRGLERDLPARLGIIEGLSLLTIGDNPEFIELLRQRITAAYMARQDEIGVKTGTLKNALTVPHGAASSRLKVEVRGGKILVSIDHPGAYYIPEKVMPQLSMTQIAREALNEWAGRVLRAGRQRGSR